jgi:tripartite-type tricarboxylate transporter receptor subunit TctC
LLGHEVAVARCLVGKFVLVAFLAACMAAAAATPLAVIAGLAQQYPARPIRLVVTFAPGGAPDVVARILSAALDKPLGQPVVVENRTGANGIVGMQTVAAAEPDGYTILHEVPAFVINPSVYKSLPFDIFRDFAAVANIGISVGYLVIVRPGLPVNSIAELIAYAKSHRVLYGSLGIGSTLHLAAALFGAKAGVEMEHVPFRGTGPVMTALLAGTIDLVFATPASSSFLTKDGLRAIGFTGKAPLAELPDLPLVKDALPGFEIEGSWQGWLAPAKTPPDIVARLNAEVRAAVKMPTVRAAIVQAGYEPTDMAPGEFAAFLHAEAERYAQAVRAAKIEPQ